MKHRMNETPLTLELQIELLKKKMPNNLSLQAKRLMRKNIRQRRRFLTKLVNLVPVVLFFQLCVNDGGVNILVS